ncbi:putative reverse transcriptase domain-containing protein [Tanacetum coccineum]
MDLQGSVENDVARYAACHVLALMCTKFLADKTKKIDKYISGLPDNIHRNVIQNDNKKKADDSSRNNQQPHKKQNVARAYTAGPGEKKAYTRTLPLCTKCNYHHTGQCAPKYGNCKRHGHATNDCRVNTNNNNNNNKKKKKKKKNQKARTCYECGNTGHIKKNCPKLKNRGNSNGNGIAQGRAYALGGRDASPDSNVITGNGNHKREESQLNIISCTKAQEYLSKGCDVFLAHITTKEDKDKSEEKRLEDVPIIRDFPEDLLGISPTQQVEFQIDLVPGAAPVARAPYRLALSEMKELAEQLQELSDKGFIRPSSSPRVCPDLVCQEERRIVSFIEGFSKIAKSITKLTQKNVKFDWGEKEEATFQLIKQKLCSAPILALPKGSKNFIVYCDTSHKGLGAVLMQNKKVIAYAS